MKIAMFTDTYDAIGGTEQAIKNSAKILHERGHEVKIIALAKGSITVLPELLKFNPEIVHVHTPGAVGNFGMLYAKARGLPVIGHFHSLPEVRLYFGDRKESKAIIEFAWRLIKLFYKSGDVVIAPTRQIKSLLSAKGIESTVIPYGIDTQTFSPKKEERGEGDKIRLLYCGQFRRDKRADMLVDMLDYLDENFELWLVGEGERKKKILAKAKKHKNRVKVFPPVPNEKLPYYYNSADIYVNASISETLGISMIEAMACGLPVVATPSPGAIEIIDDARNGYLAYENTPEDLAAKIENLKLAKDRERIGKYAREFVLKNHSVAAMGKRLEQVYSSFVK